MLRVRECPTFVRTKCGVLILERWKGGKLIRVQDCASQPTCASIIESQLITQVIMIRSGVPTELKKELL